MCEHEYETCAVCVKCGESKQETVDKQIVKKIKKSLET